MVRRFRSICGLCIRVLYASLLLQWLPLYCALFAYITYLLFHLFFSYTFDPRNVVIGLDCAFFHTIAYGCVSYLDSNVEQPLNSTMIPAFSHPSHSYLTSLDRLCPLGYVHTISLVRPPI